MRGIVVDIHDDDVAILKEDGVILKVRNNDYRIGQVITMRNNKKATRRFMTGIASLVATIAIFTIGAYAYFTPTDYVTLDVNPSIEYAVNMFDRVIEVKAVNDDAKEIIEEIDLEKMTIQEAVETTISQLIALGYLSDDEDGGIIITTYNSRFDKAGKLAKELKQEIQSYIEEQENIIAEVEVEAVGKARVEEAKALGVTPGKLNLVEKLQASGEEPDAYVLEEWLDKPVKEINKEIKENRQSAKGKINKNDDEDRDEGVEDEDIDVNKPEKVKAPNIPEKSKNIDQKQNQNQNKEQNQIQEQNRNQ
ncbi:MAG: hypothetical protein PHR60_07520 [Eubacteriales bacterium]|nr:hypothetical protein [Eubacteriales bacterium]